VPFANRPLAIGYTHNHCHPERSVCGVKDLLDEGVAMNGRSFSRSFRSLLQDDIAFGRVSCATGVADAGGRHF